MTGARHRLGWLVVVAALAVVAVGAVASCQSLRRYHAPYHEPATASARPS